MLPLEKPRHGPKVLIYSTHLANGSTHGRTGLASGVWGCIARQHTETSPQTSPKSAFPLPQFSYRSGTVCVTSVNPGKINLEHGASAVPFGVWRESESWCGCCTWLSALHPRVPGARQWTMATPLTRGPAAQSNMADIWTRLVNGSPEPNGQPLGVHRATLRWPDSAADGSNGFLPTTLAQVQVRNPALTPLSPLKQFICTQCQFNAL